LINDTPPADRYFRVVRGTNTGMSPDPYWQDTMCLWTRHEKIPYIKRQIAHVHPNGVDVPSDADMSVLSRAVGQASDDGRHPHDSGLIVANHGESFSVIRYALVTTARLSGRQILEALFR